MNRIISAIGLTVIGFGGLCELLRNREQPARPIAGPTRAPISPQPVAVERVVTLQRKEGTLPDDYRLGAVSETKSTPRAEAFERYYWRQALDELYVEKGISGGDQDEVLRFLGRVSPHIFARLEVDDLYLSMGHRRSEVVPVNPTSVAEKKAALRDVLQPVFGLLEVGVDY